MRNLYGRLNRVTSNVSGSPEEEEDEEEKTRAGGLDEGSSLPLRTCSSFLYITTHSVRIGVSSFVRTLGMWWAVLRQKGRFAYAWTAEEENVDFRNRPVLADLRSHESALAARRRAVPSTHSQRPQTGSLQVDVMLAATWNRGVSQ
jgi:hypothetical protein